MMQQQEQDVFVALCKGNFWKPLSCSLPHFGERLISMTDSGHPFDSMPEHE
jgi:hypothetical protein